MEVVAKYFLYFIIYAFLDWTMEVLCKRVELKRFVNRGFLIGPICPIYGYGVVGIILLIGDYSSDILSLFLKSILVCSILEYVTSYLMEKLFKARWWDYSKRNYNINGRICLETMLPFGLLGCFVIYFLHPVVVKTVNILNPTFQISISIFVFILYSIDNLVSFKIMNKIKKEIKKTNNRQYGAYQKKST